MGIDVDKEILCLFDGEQVRSHKDPLNDALGATEDEDEPPQPKKGGRGRGKGESSKASGVTRAR